ncbi:unnamed protein product, partial [Rotaria sordida]
YLKKNEKIIRFQYVSFYCTPLSGTRFLWYYHSWSSFKGTSIANASSMVIKQTEISNIVAFPFYYQIRISTNISSALSYSLSALIKKGDILVYVNEQPIPVKIGTESLITIDIPVMFIGENRALQPLLNNVQQSSWPELVGREGTYAVQYIKEKTGFTDVLIVLEGSLVTLDYRTDRVRVFVNTKGIVIQTPYIG